DLRRDRPGRGGRAARAGRRRRGGVRRDPGTDRATVTAPVLGADVLLQDRDLLPGVAFRAPGRVRDGRRAAQRAQPAPSGRGVPAGGPRRPVRRSGAGRDADAPVPRRPGGGRMTPDPRLSLNQRTTKRWTVAEAVDGCARSGLQAIGLWREEVAEAGLARASKLVSDAGLRVSSLCRGGFLTASEPSARSAALEDNRRAIDEAATLGAACLVLVVGGLPDGSKDLPGAREHVAEAVAELSAYAGERGVRLALEPLHPMYCADRAVLSTLAQALDLAERFPA